jgi:EAL domain-containing protein (putative c-di-GMP-specific phosphodiesterase class I)
VNGDDVYIGTSIGIAFDDGQKASGAELLRDADIAMYAAKQRGRSRWQIFGYDLRQSVERRGELERHLYTAIERDELHLVYLPIISTARGTIDGFEALVRWDRGFGGMVPPDEFIPIAEETGLIADIGRWILHTAMADLAGWRTTGPLADFVSVAVNLSPRQLREDGVTEHFAAELERSGLGPQSVWLEVSEGTVSDDAQAAASALVSLEERGFNISVDDFGSGFSSFQYLRNIPLRRLKIDPMFVRRVSTDPKDQAIARSIVAMADVLGYDVIAEGVETQEQFATIRRIGCPLAQGYLFGRPLQSSDVPGFLDAWAARYGHGAPSGGNVVSA